MECFVFAAAIFNLSCALHANQSYYSNQLYSDLFSVKNVWPLLCVDNGVWCAPAPTATPGHYGQRGTWGLPRLKPRRKRGGRRKIRVRTTDRPPHDTASSRQVCHSNLTQIKTKTIKPEKVKFGFMNIQSMNKKEDIIESLILDERLDFFLHDRDLASPIRG